MRKVQALVYYQHGPALDVVRHEEMALDDPAPDEVVVHVKAAPINPVDLNVIEGKYPVRPELPAVPGVEGAGIVAESGGNIRGVWPGVQVLLPPQAGSWREACLISGRDLVQVSDEIPPEQAAMLRINPATAWRMLHDFVSLHEGDWIIQNAANSGVGRAVIQIARALGLRTVNVVRRPELIDELQSEGADLVLCDSEDLPDRVREATAAAKIQLGLNAVGGESALHLANAMTPGGTIVTYGAMARQPLRIPNGLLIFKNLRWCGFWITKWYSEATAEQKNEMFERLFTFAREGILRAKIERCYRLTEAFQALKRAQESRREGKILFQMNS
jgi:mitochondrial enoyl-[acyl-carrier protein] reductase / trans-2-enoyl-CoA reductase